MSAMTARVRLLGRPRLDVADTGGGQPRGRKAWAVFGRLALSGRPMSRAELAAELFSEADDPLGALRWTLAELRRAFGHRDLLRGDPVGLDRSQLWVDVWALEDGTLSGPGSTGPDQSFDRPGVDKGLDPTAFDVTDFGPLLAGIELDDCPQFDLWLSSARSRTERLVRQELRQRALELLAAGETAVAVAVAGAATELDPLDEDAHELFLRALVADDHPREAAAHLAACENLFAAEGIRMSPALRETVRAPAERPPGFSAAASATALAVAGRAALAAGLADAGIATLRRADADAARAADVGLRAEVLVALGAALVHAVRGSDGEGAVVLHRGLRLARERTLPRLAAEALRELAFVDIQAGRHGSAGRALHEAGALAGGDEPATTAGLLALEGMNTADLGRHRRAVELLTRSARLAGQSGRIRQQAWSLGVLSRSLLLLGRSPEAVDAAQASIDLAVRHHWSAFLPWPQAIRAEGQLETAGPALARPGAEEAFALSCELGDPCWEGMAARALARIAVADGRPESARHWLDEASGRVDRVSDRYVWVSGYVALARLELARAHDADRAPALADRLVEQATRHDLPEFRSWALVHAAELGSTAAMTALTALRTDPGAEEPDTPALAARLSAVLAGLSSSRRRSGR